MTDLTQQTQQQISNQQRQITRQQYQDEQNYVNPSQQNNEQQQGALKEIKQNKIARQQTLQQYDELYLSLLNKNNKNRTQIYILYALILLLFMFILYKTHNNSVPTQTLQQVQKIQLGTIVAVWKSPAMGDDWLYCDGKQYDTKIYKDLYNLLGTDRLPDLRGYFLRGFDGEGVVDPDRGRQINSIQKGTFQKHTHTIEPQPSAITPDKLPPPSSTGYGLVRYSNKENNTISTAYDSQIGSNTYEMDLADIYPPKIGFEGDKETRPINIAVKYFIFARL